MEFLHCGVRRSNTASMRVNPQVASSRLVVRVALVAMGPLGLAYGAADARSLSASEAVPARSFSGLAENASSIAVSLPGGASPLS